MTVPATATATAFRAIKKGSLPASPGRGDSRDRTGDLVNAIHALSQLSYIPVQIVLPPPTSRLAPATGLSYKINCLRARVCVRPSSGGRSGFQADGGKDGSELSLWSFRHGRYSLREVHAAQQVGKAGVGAERVKFWPGIDLNKIRSVLQIGPLQPFEGGIDFAKSYINICYKI